MKRRGGWFGRDVRDEARSDAAPPVLPAAPPPPPAASAAPRIVIDVGTITDDLAQRVTDAIKAAEVSRQSLVANRKCDHVFSDGSVCMLARYPEHEHCDDVRDPAPGLHEAISGHPLPSFTELRARYGDPGDLPPVSKAQADRVDFREMLTTDRAWSVKSRLEVALGRPYLATKIAEQLDPETAARLCDRVEALLSAAFDVARNQIAAEVSSAVDARIHAWQAEQDRRAKAVTRERFAPRPE